MINNCFNYVGSKDRLFPFIDKNLDKLIDFIDVRDNKYWAYYEIFEAANTHYIRFLNGFAKWVD